MGCFDSLKSDAPVDRFHHGGRQDINSILILRVGKNVGVVPAAIAYARIVINMLPGLSCVVGTEDTAVDCLDHCPHPVGIGARDADTGIPHQLWKTFLQLLPAVATVGGLVQTTAGTAASYIPGLAAVVPHGRINDAGIPCIHTQKTDAGVRINKQRSLPASTAIGRAIHTTLLGGRPGTPLRAHVYDIGICWMYRDFRDLARFCQANVLPGLARVAGLVNAITMRR